MTLFEGQEWYLTAFEEDIALAGEWAEGKSILLKLLLLLLRVAWVLAEYELWLAAVASVV